MANFGWFSEENFHLKNQPLFEVKSSFCHQKMQNTWLLLRNGDADAKNSIFGLSLKIQAFFAEISQNWPNIIIFGLKLYRHNEIRTLRKFWRRNEFYIISRSLSLKISHFCKNQPKVAKIWFFSSAWPFLNKSHIFCIFWW